MGSVPEEGSEDARERERQVRELYEADIRKLTDDEKWAIYTNLTNAQVGKCARVYAAAPPSHHRSFLS
jgi:hypothetical protein